MERYTDESLERIIAKYNSNPTYEHVKVIAEEENISAKSIVAKLSSLGVYKTAERKTKDGKDIIKKEDLVASIETMLGQPMPTLVKSGKQDLRILEELIRGRISFNEE